MPETILSLSYIGITIYNVTILFKSIDYLVDVKWQLTRHIVLICVLLLLIIFDMALRVSKLTSQVYNVDSEIKKTLAEFESTVWDDERGHFEQPACQKEFSFYKDCFTLTLRNGRWRQVPSNTLATGDIIKLLPGDLAPAFIKPIGNGPIGVS